MKSTILLLIAATISISSFAQQDVSFGVKAGITYSGMRGEAVNSLQDLLSFSNDIITTVDQAGIFAGANVSIPVAKGFKVQPGLYYSQKGYALKGSLNLKGRSFLGANAKARLQAHYIDLPVFAEAEIGGLRIFAGPQVSYLTKADLRFTAGALGINLLDEKTDATGYLNRWDAAVTGGVGYQFSNGMNIAASYDHGISKADVNKSINIHNRSFKLGIGINF